MNNIRLHILLMLICLIFCFQKGHTQDTLTYQLTQSKEASKIFKKNQEFKVYRLDDNNTLHLGDTLIVGNPATSNTTTFYGNNVSGKVYMSILVGEYKISPFMFKGINYMMDGSQGRKLIINKIYCLVMKGVGIPFIQCYEDNYKNNIFTLLYIDKAIKDGEILNPHAQMTKEEALSKLKKAKELLDLDLMTKEKYNTIKDQLSPIILEQK